MTSAILYVDSTESHLRLFKTVFQREFRITVARSSSEGLCYLKEKPFQILIADYRLRQMNGVEFLQEAARHQPEAVRLIAGTHADRKALIDTFHNDQIFDYILHPWRYSTLVSTLRDAAAYQQEEVEKIGDRKPLIDVRC